MRRCPRCHVRLNAPVQGLMDNIQRYTNNTVVYEAFPPQYKPTDSPGSAISTSHILSGIVRARRAVLRRTHAVSPTLRRFTPLRQEADLRASRRQHHHRQCRVRHLPRTLVKKQIFVLPDGNITSASAERLQYHERLFQPSFFGMALRTSASWPKSTAEITDKERSDVKQLWCFFALEGAEIHSSDPEGCPARAGAKTPCHE